MITVSSIESYMRQGHVHMANDETITLAQTKKYQQNNNEIGRMLGNVFRIGAVMSTSG